MGATVVETKNETAKKEPMRIHLNKNKVKEKEVREPSKRMSVNDRREKRCSFADDDLENLLENLLAMKLVEFPKLKKSKEQDKVDDPKYNKYHRLVSHCLKDCFVFKHKIQVLLDKQLITLNDILEGTTSANPIMVSELLAEVVMLIELVDDLKDG